MKVGLIARCEDRGLGVMTWAFHRHMRPDRTLLIRPDATIGRGFEQHAGRYPDAVHVPWGGGALDEDAVRGFLDGLDVVYSAETFYDPRIPEWAREAGVATVLHVMPEFHNPDLPAPTMRWLPTSWRAEQFPGVSVVPVPVEAARLAVPSAPNAPLRLLHVVGHRAAGDRNGTTTILQMLRMIRSRVDVTIVCQDRRLPSVRTAPTVHLRRLMGGERSLDALYAEHDVIVIPRRYGGLCLPAQEALSFGKALIMPDVSPNRDWPIIGVPATLNDGIRTVAGEIPFATTEPRAFATVIESLAQNRVFLSEWNQRAHAWSWAHTWDALRPTYQAMLAEACARVSA